MKQAAPLISGIQQIGIGNAHIYDTWRWYREHFNFDVPIFDEAAEARLMLPYTGGEPRKRHAILALNLRGGGGLEIWQYTERTPQAPDFTPQMGDTGIYVLKIKSSDTEATFNFLKNKNARLLNGITRNPASQKHFFLSDPFGNLVEVVEETQGWFSKGRQSMGGVFGCTIGVTNIDRSLPFYKEILGYDEIVFDEEASFNDFACLPGGDKSFRRVLLRHSQPRQGAFSRLLGSNEIELVQVINRQPRQIFENRFWGDLGYIHICFDISGMDAMRQKCEALGFPFTVDSGPFDMGEAAGHFSYIEDPDGTLIEFVETHKVPLLKKIGWYLDLRKRPQGKSLPDWMVKALGFGRVKN